MIKCIDLTTTKHNVFIQPWFIFQAVNKRLIKTSVQDVYTTFVCQQHTLLGVHFKRKTYTELMDSLICGKKTIVKLSSSVNT